MPSVCYDPELHLYRFSDIHWDNAHADSGHNQDGSNAYVTRFNGEEMSGEGVVINASCIPWVNDSPHDYCSWRFGACDQVIEVSEAGIKKHLKECHGYDADTSKVHTCRWSKCNKLCPAKEQLFEHIRIDHLKLEDLLCPVCRDPDSQGPWRTLKKHIKKMHPLARIVE